MNALFFVSFLIAQYDECACPGDADTCPKRDSCNYFQGFIVAAFPLGQFISSPIFGWWSSKRPAKEVRRPPPSLTPQVLIVSLIITSGGYAMFSACHTGWLLLASRLIVGFGSGWNCRKYF